MKATVFRYNPSTKCVEALPGELVVKRLTTNAGPCMEVQVIINGDWSVTVAVDAFELMESVREGR